MESAQYQQQIKTNMAIEDRLKIAIQSGLKVNASIRGFRVAFSPETFFYIDLVAIDSRNKSQEIEIGFWPGMTNNLTKAENILNSIKKKYAQINIFHLKEPIYLKKSSCPSSAK